MTTGYPRDNIGPYRVVRLLGRGGFGSVFLCEQTEPVRREVAVKVLNPGHGRGRDPHERFQVERETLNLMKHPGIAMLLDAGVTEEDEPFFAMEFVAGDPARGVPRGEASSPFDERLRAVPPRSAPPSSTRTRRA